VAEYYYADKTLIEKAIDVALESRESWERMSAEDRQVIKTFVTYFHTLDGLLVAIISHYDFM